jgi:hypothetical protein
MSRICEQLSGDLFTPRPVGQSFPEGVPIDVCILFERLALEVSRMGFTHYSARDLTARIRWHHQIDRGDREFRVNNNWSPAIARWFIARHPEMANFFELRESPGGRDD